MATIESLDLATLTNNPQSIAEALEDVLEITGTTIGALKADALTDQLYIKDFLRPQAQADHDAIEVLYNNTNATRHHYTTLTGGFASWSVTSETSGDEGVYVQNIGRIWIINIVIEGGGLGTGIGNADIVDISNEFTVPSATVIMGMQHFGNSGENEYMGSLQILTDGTIKLYYNNHSGGTLHCIGNFMGIDIG